MGRRPQPAARNANESNAGCRTKMLLMDVSSGSARHDKATAAQRHHLGPAIAGSVSSGPFAGDCRYQPAPRGHNDICHRRRIHQVDVLGHRISDVAAIVELVHFVRSPSAFARRRNCDRMAGESSGGLGSVHDQLRRAATGADARRIFCVARDSGRCFRPTSAAFRPGGDVSAGNADHLQPATELQHRNAVRDRGCVGQCVESPSRDDYANRCSTGADRSDLEFRHTKAIYETCGCGTGTANGFRYLETAGFDDVGTQMNLGNMSFDNGILHLANWMGNVIMPTLAAVFIIMAILQFSKGQEFSHSMYGALACLLVSGLTRAFETFASQAAWNNPDLYWITIRTLIDWVANVILPVYAAGQVAAMALRLGILSLVQPTSGWLRHFVTAALCLMVSGLLRLAEFFVAQGGGGVT